MHIPSLFTGTSERNKEQPKSYQSREEAIREEGQRVNLSAHWNVGVKKESIGCVSEYMLARELCKDVKTADKMLVGTEWDDALAYARGEEFAWEVVRDE